jgi:hypothetical protein
MHNIKKLDSFQNFCLQNKALGHLEHCNMTNNLLMCVLFIVYISVTCKRWVIRIGNVKTTLKLTITVEMEISLVRHIYCLDRETGKYTVATRSFNCWRTGLDNPKCWTCALVLLCTKNKLRIDMMRLRIDMRRSGVICTWVEVSVVCRVLLYSPCDPLQSMLLKR